MEENKKVPWKALIVLIISFVIFYILLYLYGNEALLSADTMGNLYELYNAKINETVLFETNDYIITKKIRRYNPIFTQGFLMDTNETIIESGGLYKESLLQRFNIDIPDMPISMINLRNDYFGEGCTLFKGKIYQLTWRERKM
jgi:glutamine cyclotransferase